MEANVKKTVSNHNRVVKRVSFIKQSKGLSEITKKN